MCLCVKFFSVCLRHCKSVCTGGGGVCVLGGCWGDLEPINSPVWTTGPNSAFLSGHKGFSLPGLY